MSKVSGEIHIDAPKDKVWAVLADLGAVNAWNPAIANSYYTSGATEGVGASRYCDFPDGGYVKEETVEWKPGEVVRLDILDTNVPFDNFYGEYTLRDNGQGTVVTFTLGFDVLPDAPLDPAEAERQNREELIPLVLAGLKHCVETGQPLPMPPQG